MNKKRPINLDLMSLKYPPMAIASLLHRITGIVLFLLMPFALYFLARSLRSEHNYGQVQFLISQPLWKILIWIFGSAMIYHLLAGIRHLLMDAGFGEHLESGRNSARAVIGLSIFLSILLGFWIW